MSILFDYNEDPTKPDFDRIGSRGNVQSETAKKYDNLLVFGYHCKLFRNDEAAIKQEQMGLIPWMGDGSLMIDRYDGRGHLFSIKDFDFSDSAGASTTDEDEIERICDQERYMDLQKDMVEENILKEEDEKRSRNLYDPETAYQSIKHTYDDEVKEDDAFIQYCEYYKYDKNDPEVKKYFEGLKVYSSYEYSRPPPPPEPAAPSPAAAPHKAAPPPTPPVKQKPPEKFRAPDGIVIPEGLAVPQTAKMQGIVEKTALFISKQGTQMEIVLKTKQAGNPQFDFLAFDNWLNPFYKFVLEGIKTGKYKSTTTTADEEKKEDKKNESDQSENEEEGELHPLLQAHRRPLNKPAVVSPKKEYIPKSKTTGKVEDMAKIYLTMKYKKNDSPPPSHPSPPPTHPHIHPQSTTLTPSTHPPRPFMVRPPPHHMMHQHLPPPPPGVINGRPPPPFPFMMRPPAGQFGHLPTPLHQGGPFRMPPNNVHVMPPRPPLPPGMHLPPGHLPPPHHTQMISAPPPQMLRSPPPAMLTARAPGPSPRPAPPPQVVRLQGPPQSVPMDVEESDEALLPPGVEENTPFFLASEKKANIPPPPPLPPTPKIEEIKAEKLNNPIPSTPNNALNNNNTITTTPNTKTPKKNVIAPVVATENKETKPLVPTKMVPHTDAPTKKLPTTSDTTPTKIYNPKDDIFDTTERYKPSSLLSKILQSKTKKPELKSSVGKYPTVPEKKNNQIGLPLIQAKITTRVLIEDSKSNKHKHEGEEDLSFKRTRKLSETSSTSSLKRKYDQEESPNRFSRNRDSRSPESRHYSRSPDTFRRHASRSPESIRRASRSPESLRRQSPRKSLYDPHDISYGEESPKRGSSEDQRYTHSQHETNEDAPPWLQKSKNDIPADIPPWERNSSNSRENNSSNTLEALISSSKRDIPYDRVPQYDDREGLKPFFDEDDRRHQHMDDRVYEQSDNERVPRYDNKRVDEDDSRCIDEEQHMQYDDNKENLLRQYDTGDVYHDRDERDRDFSQNLERQRSEENDAPRSILKKSKNIYKVTRSPPIEDDEENKFDGYNDREFERDRRSDRQSPERYNNNSNGNIREFDERENNYFRDSDLPTSSTAALLSNPFDFIAKTLKKVQQSERSDSDQNRPAQVDNNLPNNQQPIPPDRLHPAGFDNNLPNSIPQHPFVPPNFPPQGGFQLPPGIPPPPRPEQFITQAPPQNYPNNTLPAHINPQLQQQFPSGHPNNLQHPIHALLNSQHPPVNFQHPQQSLINPQNPLNPQHPMNPQPSALQAINLVQHNAPMAPVVMPPAVVNTNQQPPPAAFLNQQQPPTALQAINMAQQPAGFVPQPITQQPHVIAAPLQTVAPGAQPQLQQAPVHYSAQATQQPTPEMLHPIASLQSLPPVAVNILQPIAQHQASQQPTQELLDQLAQPVDPSCLPPPPDIQPVVDRLALYVAKNGDEFESGIRGKGDPRFDFLNTWSVYHNYYTQQKLLKRQQWQQEQQQEEERKKTMKVSFGLKGKTKAVVTGKSTLQAKTVFNNEEEEEEEEGKDDGFKPNKEKANDIKKKLEQQIEEKERLLKQLQEQAMLQAQVTEVSIASSTPQQLAQAKRQSQTSSSLKEAKKRKISEAKKRKEERKQKAAAFAGKLKKEQSPPPPPPPPLPKKNDVKQDAFFEAINQAFKGK